MDQNTVPSAPLGESMGIPSAPPSYDEAMRNVTAGSGDQNIPNPPRVTEEDELKKNEKKQDAPPLATAPVPPVVTQPIPETTYAFQQPVTQQPQPANDCCLCCYFLDAQDIDAICYCLFCCSRHTTGHDAGCCDCGDGCCSCPDGCCECGDCDCDCGDCDCDCGDCDCGGCDCDCGDCTII